MHKYYIKNDTEIRREEDADAGFEVVVYDKATTENLVHDMITAIIQLRNTLAYVCEECDPDGHIVVSVEYEIMADEIIAKAREMINE